MIDKSEVKQVIDIYKLDMYDKITDKDINQILHNINGNLIIHIYDEIKFYLENK